MKKLLLFLAISSTFLFSSCHGEDGQDGINILGQVFETTVNFHDSNNYRVSVPFPSGVEVFESDVVLVYLLEGITPNGGDDIWSQLPQTYFNINGNPEDILLYSFDHTFFDAEIFLDGNFDLGTLGSIFTDDQTFRIAIVPAEFASADLSMEDLLQNLEINNSQIETISN